RQLTPEPLAPLGELIDLRLNVIAESAELLQPLGLDLSLNAKGIVRQPKLSDVGNRTRDLFELGDEPRCDLVQVGRLADEQKGPPVDVAQISIVFDALKRSSQLPLERLGLSPGILNL